MIIIMEHEQLNISTAHSINYYLLCIVFVLYNKLNVFNASTMVFNHYLFINFTCNRFLVYLHSPLTRTTAAWPIDATADVRRESHRSNVLEHIMLLYDDHIDGQSFMWLLTGEWCVCFFLFFSVWCRCRCRPQIQSTGWRWNHKLPLQLSQGVILYRHVLIDVERNNLRYSFASLPLLSPPLSNSLYLSLCVFVYFRISRENGIVFFIQQTKLRLAHRNYIFLRNVNDAIKQANLRSTTHTDWTIWPNKW